MKQTLKGQTGEEIAFRYLSRLGWRIVARNFAAPTGELDLVALEGDVLVFVEVKRRLTGRYGTPAEAVTAEKRRKLVRTAAWFVKAHRLEGMPYRFDIVEVYDTDPVLIRNAFEARTMI